MILFIQLTIGHRLTLGLLLVLMPWLFGCTDSLATNYDPIAIIDDSSCYYYVYGCMDSTMWNYNPLQILMMVHVYHSYMVIDSNSCSYDILAKHR